jgi:hypothetical protein
MLRVYHQAQIVFGLSQMQVGRAGISVIGCGRPFYRTAAPYSLRPKSRARLQSGRLSVLFRTNRVVPPISERARVHQSLICRVGAWSMTEAAAEFASKICMIGKAAGIGDLADRLLGAQQVPAKQKARGVIQAN